MSGWDGNTVATLSLAVAVLGDLIATIAFMVRTAHRAEEAAKAAAEAKVDAEKAQKRADDAHEKLAMFRAEYVRGAELDKVRDELLGAVRGLSDRMERFLEERLMGAITRLGDRLNGPEPEGPRKGRA